MTPEAASILAFPDPDPLDYGANDEGSTLYRNACIATELRREGFIARMKQEGWISVEDRLPEAIKGFNHSEACLVWTVNGGEQSVRRAHTAYYHHRPPFGMDPHWSSMAAHEMEGVTHWMPLPPAPVPLNPVTQKT